MRAGNRALLRRRQDEPSDEKNCKSKKFHVWERIERGNKSVFDAKACAPGMTKRDPPRQGGKAEVIISFRSMHIPGGPPRHGRSTKEGKQPQKKEREQGRSTLRDLKRECFHAKRHSGSKSIQEKRQGSENMQRIGR